MNRERAIEDAIIAHPDVLGFAGARAIRNVRGAETCGRVDVMLLPTSGPTRLVLVEAKVTKAPDAASKVVGQLLMYYGGALYGSANVGGATEQVYRSRQERRELRSIIGKVLGKASQIATQRQTRTADSRLDLT